MNNNKPRETPDMTQARTAPGTALALALSFATASAPLQARLLALYDDGAGDLPQDQPWLAFLKFPLRQDVPLEGLPGTGVRVDSGADGPSGQSGFTTHLLVPPFPTIPKNPFFPALDPIAGFTLSFELQLHAEAHTSADRAGFSVLLLGHDRRGIELGFWQDEIWAQDERFRHAEGAPADTISAEVLYELTIQGIDYWLTADGTRLLDGTTRDYTAASPIPDPYEVGDLVFLGDDTGSAWADYTLGRVALRTRRRPPEGGRNPAPAVPTPPVWSLLLTAALAGRARAAGGDTAPHPAARTSSATRRCAFHHKDHPETKP